MSRVLLLISFMKSRVERELYGTQIAVAIFFLQTALDNIAYNFYRCNFRSHVKLKIQCVVITATAQVEKP